MQVNLYAFHMISETTGWGLVTGADKWANGVVAINGEYRVIRTSDGGCSFQGAGSWELDQSDHLDFFPLSEKIALAFLSQQVYRTINAGTSWEEGSLPITSGESIWVLSLTFPDAQHGWLLLQIRDTPSVLLLSTEDGGRNFRQVLRINTETPLIPDISSWSTVQFLDQQTGWITVVREFGTAAPQQHWLYLTRDGGKHWTPQSLPLPPGVQSTCNLRLEQPHFFSQQEGVISASVNSSWDDTPNGFLTFVTHDGGTSWQCRPFVAVDYNELAIKAVEPGGVYLTVYRSTPAPQFTDMRFGWVGDPSLALFTTNDGGLSWQPLASSSPLKEANQLHFLSSELGWVVTKSEDKMSSYLYKTSDGGVTWTSLPALLL